jgi:hypothetical protein
MLMQTGTLTAFCTVVPLIQTFLITWVKNRHPEIENYSKKEGGTIQNLDYLKENYKKLVRGTLPGDEKHKHHANIYSWLQIKNMSTNNFSPEERETLAEQMKTNTCTIQNNKSQTFLEQSVDVEKLDWMREALDEKTQNGDKDFTVQTPMMKVINHHVNIDWWVARLEHINYGLKLSKETVLSASRMPWRGVVEELRQTSSSPSLPKAVTFNAVRKLAGKEWDKSKSGNRLDAFHLIVKPWKGIQTDADSYLNSFLFDVWMHWLQVWFSLVTFNFIISSNYFS